MVKVLPNYLFTGPERGEKDKAVGEIIDSYKTNCHEVPEVYRFYPFEVSLGEIVALLKNGSLFSGYKFVLVYNIEEFKKSELPVLVEYLKVPSDSATLILMTDTYKVDSKISSLIGKGGLRTFWELFENQKRERIFSFFSREKKRITPEAVDMILETVENHTKDLELAAGQLVSFFCDTDIITEEEVETYIYHSKEENVFTLFGHMVKGDFPGSVEIVHALALSGENNPVQLLSGLLWQYQNLLKLKQFTAGGMHLEEAFKKAAIRGKRNQAIYSAAMEKHSPHEIMNIIKLIAYYDRRAREIKKERWTLLMELFLYYSLKHRGSRKNYSQT